MAPQKPKEEPKPKGGLIISRYGLALAVAGWIVLLAAPSVVLADPFDGTYAGKRVAAKGDDPSCPTADNVSVTIKGGTLTFTDSNAKDYAISFDPRPDGSFRKLSADVGGTVVDIRGRVSGSTLDADVTSAHCQHHWSLERQ
jgi:hypothetical protein